VKLVYIAGFAWEPKGTVRARAFPLAAEMVRRGHTVTLLVVPYDNQKYSGMEFVREGVRIINLKVPARMSVSYAAIPRRLSAAIDQTAPDLVHVFKPKGFAAIAAKRVLRANQLPLVLDCDDWEGWGGWNEETDHPWLIKELIDRQERSLIRRSHVVTCASRALAQRAHDMNRVAADVFYVPNGVSPRQVEFSDQMLRVPSEERKRALGFGDDLILLYAGHFESKEDLDFFCQAVFRISSARKMTVALVGDGPQLSHALSSLTASPGVTVRSFGALSYEEYASVLAAADIAAFPYPDTPVYRAKCSARIIDYMLYAKPVLTTAVGENNHYFVHEESGLLIAPSEPFDFKNGLMRLVEDSSLRERLGRNARRQILQRFSWEGSLGDQCECAYRRALVNNRTAHRAGNIFALNS
jgi:glycosyltransferase involved in cell wall biosynthesis